MPLVNMADMLNHAYRHNYAVGAFHLVSLDFLSGIVEAAENRHAPVILSLAESHFEYYDFELLMAACVVAAKRATVPVAIHLDHGASLETAIRAIRMGCNGVMVDTSAEPLGDNLHMTQQVVAMGRACGIAVEGELGYVPGLEGDDAVRYPGDLTYTTAAQAKTYVERTGVDSLAVSVGTVHGHTKGTPRLDYARLGKINDAVGIPLVIHGGSGLSDDQCRKLIAHGVAKINYFTAMAEAAGSEIRRRADAGDTNSATLTHGVKESVRIEVERCIRVWGSGGRAAEVLSQCRPWREVEHVLLFNVDRRLDKTEAATWVSQGMKSLAAIPGVKSVAYGEAMQADVRYRQCWLVRFASDTVTPGYLDHPEYSAYADSMFHLAATERISIDYKIGE
jgi:fructose-bisphosphate aldolase, class II